jgi:hypothetical protein
MLGFELVQIKNCCLDLPIGVEVSDGVRIAPIPSNISLPSNIKIVQKFKKTPLPSWMIPLKCLDTVTGSVTGNVKTMTSESDLQDDSNIFHCLASSTLNSNNVIDSNESEETEGDINLPFILRQMEGINILPKSKSIKYELGMELIYHPIGHSLPYGMKLVPKSDYPAGFSLSAFPANVALVQLIPKYDFPPSCRLNTAWYFYPRPDGISLKAGSYLLYPDPSLEDHMIPPLPSYACQIPLPNLPYGVKLPTRTVCVELLLTRFTSFPLPEGAILAPGITVLNPKSLHGWNPSRRCPLNIVLVKRTPGSVLPPTVERGKFVILGCCALSFFLPRSLSFFLSSLSLCRQSFRPSRWCSSQ